MIRISRRSSHNTMRITRCNRAVFRVKRINTSFHTNTINRNRFRVVHTKGHMNSGTAIRNSNKVTRHRLPYNIHSTLYVTHQLVFFRVDSQYFHIRLHYSTIRNHVRHIIVRKLRRVSTYLRLMTRRNRVDT